MNEIDQHTASARQLVMVMISQQAMIAQFIQRSKVSLQPMDATPLVLDCLSAQSRTLAFILDELLLARGAERAITFVDPKEKGNGLALVKS